MPSKKLEQLDVSYKTFVKFFLVLGGVALITVGIGGFNQLAGLISGSIFNSQPLFNSTDSFVLFGSEEVVLEEGTRVSSGDLGSNKIVDIQKDVIVNGNLFADKITIDKDTTINGGISYNNLKTKKETQIFGATTTPVSLPIASFPDIPDFQTGTRDFTFTGTSTANALPAGNYRNIVVEKNSRLTLIGDVASTSSTQIYNLRKLELKDGAILIFNTLTTINIQFKFRGHDKVSILPGANIAHDGLSINYLGIKSKKEKEEREDDDDEINSYLDDDKEQNDHKQGKIGRPVILGKNSFLNFKLLAPKAKVDIGKESTIRGQILARKIKVEKEGVLSREEGFEKEGVSQIIREDEDGVQFIGNEILIALRSGATINDAIFLAELVGGKITGYDPNPPLYKIEILTDDIINLQAALLALNNSGHPFLVGAVPNVLILQDNF